MIDKRKRDEVWERNKRYMETPEETLITARDLLPICKDCKCFSGIGSHNFEECRNKPCFELWLSNEYLEWCNEL